MLATLALTAVLTAAPAQNGEVKLINQRVTYGFRGPTRTSLDFLPGDALFVAFDIQGLQANKAGEVVYRMGMEITDAGGTAIFKQKPAADLKAVNSLGGDQVPAFAVAEVRTDTKPGKYTLTVTVHDDKGTERAKLVKPFNVLKSDFGIVGVSLFYDQSGNVPASPIASVGQVVWVQYGVTGFQRDPKTKKPTFSVTMRVLDEKGQPVVAPRPGGVDKDTPGTDNMNLTAIPMMFVLAMNRPGKFTIE
ncbi:MAG TPA: hypothetical protein VFA26_17785, partial [Gemmataceae bacterium]|nr:hypothetical protein [Gemmataceae bacterium]